VPDPAFWKKFMFTRSFRWRTFEGEAEDAQHLSHALRNTVDNSTDRNPLRGRQVLRKRLLTCADLFTSGRIANPEGDSACSLTCLRPHEPRRADFIGNDLHHAAPGASRSTIAHCKSSGFCGDRPSWVCSGGACGQFVISRSEVPHQHER